MMKKKFILSLIAGVATSSAINAASTSYFGVEYNAGYGANGKYLSDLTNGVADSGGFPYALFLPDFESDKTFSNTIGAMVGYHFNDTLRGEISLNHRGYKEKIYTYGNDITTATATELDYFDTYYYDNTNTQHNLYTDSSTTTPFTDGTLEIANSDVVFWNSTYGLSANLTDVMFSLAYDMNINEHFKPYVIGGLGYGSLHIKRAIHSYLIDSIPVAGATSAGYIASADSLYSTATTDATVDYYWPYVDYISTISSKNKGIFTYQAGLGFMVKMDKCSYIDIGYRYHGGGKKEVAMDSDGLSYDSMKFSVGSHLFSLGFKYSL